MFLQLLVVAAALAASGTGQRITTIQLDGVQYFISRMNPYSPELNYFLAYQYCRSIGLQLASFETKEKSDSIMQYLINAGYNKYDFWTSGNRLGTDMLIWMSTGLPFNATFDYMKKNPGEEMPVARQLGAVEQRKDSGASSGCVLLRAPDLQWDINDCTDIKDFICEQTRCYYYNYGSIPVSSAQGVGPVKGRSSSMPLMPQKERSSSSTTTSQPQTSEKTVRTTQEQQQTTTEYSTAEPEQPEEVSTAASENITEQQTTTVQNKARLLSRNQQPDNQLSADNVPWSWARNIMLEKPVLKKTANL